MLMWFLAIAVVGLGLLFSAFFSGAETGMYCVNRVRLHLGTQRREPDALRLARVLDDEQAALSVALLGTNVANYVTTAAVAFILADLLGFGEVDTELYTVMVLTPVVFVFGEVVPKSLFQMHADRLMTLGAKPLVVVNVLFRVTGLVAVLKALAGAMHWLVRPYGEDRRPHPPKLRVARLLQEALAGHELAVDQTELVDRVCQLSETPLHAVMVPRNRVNMIPAAADRRQLERLARRTRHAHLPVFDTQHRHVIGIAKVRELLRYTDWKTVGERIRPVVTLSPHDTVAVATKRMQTKGQKIAVVADRGGRMLGVVTLQDLIEEVLGELAGSD